MYLNHLTSGLGKPETLQVNVRVWLADVVVSSRSVVKRGACDLCVDLISTGESFRSTASSKLRKATSDILIELVTTG